MASHRIPTNPVGLYWVYWNPFKRLIDFPTTYNIIFLFHAYPADGEPTGGTTGAVVLRKPTGTIGTNLNADIATCRARGQKILVSVGGAGGQVYITSQARADAFIQSIKDMNVGLGGSGTTAAFDGIDWNNFEGVQQGSQGAWMTYAGQQLRAYYGDNFAFTAPPAGFSLAGPGAQPTSDRLLLAEMYQGGVLDWLCPQFYDPSDLNTLANARLGLDVYNTAVTVNGSSVQIPRDYIGVGFAVAATATTARWSPSGAASAYTQLVADGRAPKGAFNWANHEDTGDSFATTVAPVITNNTSTAAPAFALASSTNFADSDATTAQLDAPSGKTSGADFQAGEMCETSNPAPAIDLGSGKYTEIEWNIQATSDAVNAQQYEFRVTYNGASLDTYTVTPKWTIGTPVSQGTPPTGAPVASLIASTSKVGTLNTVTTDAIDTTGANFIVLAIAIDAGATPTISDSKGNTWVALSSSSQTVKTILYYSVNPTVGTGHTFSNTAAGNYCAIAVQAFSRIRTASPFAEQNGATSTGTTTISTGAVSPVFNDALIVTAAGFNAAGLNLTIDSGFTVTGDEEFGSGNNYGIAMAYLIQSTAASVNPTWTRGTGTGAMSTRIATFKPVAGGVSTGFSSITGLSSITM